jgi:hypothetical protein
VPFKKAAQATQWVDPLKSLWSHFGEHPVYELVAPVRPLTLDVGVLQIVHRPTGGPWLELTVGSRLGHGRISEVKSHAPKSGNLRPGH